ncbi:RusA family crossover junction endodeoxyribonuclease [Corynebacterium sp. zg-331]|uniref:RusA family crossover junction endodeoxyribonuclease n=1 Tax=unclassified Corynebacterium TaxID=2624378 RepID=UPI00128B1967|nr:MULTISPECIES: RusA family crossover junction endodeoxyribonuclease [unclassified Corynebacterium]MBC3186381.1 RusA family crossover junction endodeoxyribonuclease [Corynebacterium sp. zg-331]MPV52868.1 RusA family crossover junction endodeoxyribonuclease [Corynebacterium sp. zg331]
MTRIKLFVPGLPAPQGSKRHVGGGRLVESSKNVKSWRSTIARTAREHITQPLEGPIELHVDFHMPRPKNWGCKRNDPMIQRPDLDKLLRAVDDALTGVAFRDDSQVTRLIGHKHRALHNAPTGALITIYTLKEAL